MRGNYNQELLYLRKIVLQHSYPLKMGPKSKKLSEKTKNNTKGEITQVWNELWPKLFYQQLAFNKGLLKKGY